MFDKATLEEVLFVVSRPTFLLDRSVYKPVIESLVNIGILKLQQSEPAYGQTIKPRIMYAGIVKKYEIAASSAYVTEEKGRKLLEQLKLTDIDFEDIRREGSKIIQIAKSKLPIHWKSYIEIHYGQYADFTQLQF